MTQVRSGGGGGLGFSAHQKTPPPPDPTFLAFSYPDQLSLQQVRDKEIHKSSKRQNRTSNNVQTRARTEEAVKTEGTPTNFRPIICSICHSVIHTRRLHTLPVSGNV